MKIKVLEIIGDGSLAGAPRHLLSILEHLDLDKFEISCICPPGPLAGEIKDLRRHVELETISMNSRSDIKAISKIRQTIKHIKPNIIHIHGNRAGALGRLASIGFGVPVVYTEHLWTKDFNLNNHFLNYIHHIGGWFLDLFTTQNIAVSQAVKDFMIDSSISYAEKIKVIYNGIEPTKVRAHIMEDYKEIKLGTVATLVPLKGIQYLLESLKIIQKELPQVKLEIIGDGPYKPNLVQLTKKLKLEKSVKFSGFVPDIEEKLASFDLYVQPSTSESFGLAIVQAMSVGLPIVATQTGGIPEVVTEGKSGLLVAPAKPKAMAEAILQIIYDRSKAKQMGEMARRESIVRFNLKDMIQELESTYEEVAENPSFTQ